MALVAGSVCQRVDIFRQDIFRQDIFRQDIFRQDIFRQDIFRQDIFRQDIFRQDGDIGDGEHTADDIPLTLSRRLYPADFVDTSSLGKLVAADPCQHLGPTTQ